MIDKNIGSARDNMSSAVHNWYKFTAGFSYKFVDMIIDDMPQKPNTIYEPFAGCGTTLVASQKKGVAAIGNESQELMCNIINAKLNWDIERTRCAYYIKKIYNYMLDNNDSPSLESEFHPLLCSLYDLHTLKELYLIRDFVNIIQEEHYKLFFNLALSQTLHKVALFPIAVPYISRSKHMANPGHAWEKFNSIIDSMLEDLESLPTHKRTAQVYKADSRLLNDSIENGCCNLCITSPPYLNNLDYGEVSKVHTHFFNMTNNWHDITEKIRANLVTGSTTHYRDNEFDLDKFKKSEFALSNTLLMPELEDKYYRIKDAAHQRKGKKSFHILMMHYFSDMFDVFREMRRVLQPNSPAYLILGDSAPYGVYIQTTQYLGEMAKSVGFEEFEIYKIRSRGNKWKNLKNRHNIELSENILKLK